MELQYISGASADGSVGGTVVKHARRAKDRPTRYQTSRSIMRWEDARGDRQSQGPFRNPVLDVVLGAEGRAWMAVGGRWIGGRGQAWQLAPSIPDRCSGYAFRLPILGGGSQTGWAPFIFELGNGQVLVCAVCVTATVLTYHQLPCLLNTEHHGSLSVCRFIQSWSGLG